MHILILPSLGTVNNYKTASPERVKPQFLIFGPTAKKFSYALTISGTFTGIKPKLQFESLTFRDIFGVLLEKEKKFSGASELR